MSYDSKLEAAVNLQKAERYGDAINAYLKILKTAKKIKGFNSQQLLALCYHQQGNNERSEYAYEKAIKLNPEHAATRNNFGNLLVDLLRFKDARKQFEKAIKINPVYAEAHSNLGNCLQKQHDVEQASQHYLKAIRLDNQEARYYANLGVSFTKQGLFEDALDILKKGHNINPSLSAIYVHLFDLLMMMHSVDDATNIALSSINEKLLSGAEKCAMHIGLAISNWLQSDLIALQSHLNSSKEIHVKFESYSNTNNLRVFHNYLSKLYHYRIENSAQYNSKATKTLVMVSESHGFSPSGTIVNFKNEDYKIKSFLITGCKIWHISQEKNNMYKESLRLFFSQLPKQCDVIIGFGEIDCRVSEGIYTNLRIQNIDYRSSIPTMVVDYLTNLLELSKEHDHKLIIYGIPAPQECKVSSLQGVELTNFLNMIKLINQQLAHHCQVFEFPFLDIYNLTKDTSGKSNSKWHIDDTHVHPKSIIELFDQLLTTAST